MSSSESEDFLKKVFSGESLNGYIEAAQVIPLDIFVKAPSHELVKTLLASKGEQTITIGQVQVNANGDSVVMLCASGKELLEANCHVREANKKEELFQRLKEALVSSGYEIREVELHASTNPSDYF